MGFVAHDDAPYTIGSATEDVYDFVRRNLARGYSRQELNVSFLKGQKYKLQNKVDSIRSDVHEKINKWEEQSKEMISNFLHMFTTPAIEQIWNSGKERIARAISPSPPHSRSGSPGPEEEEADEPTEKKMRLN